MAMRRMTCLRLIFQHGRVRSAVCPTSRTAACVSKRVTGRTVHVSVCDATLSRRYYATSQAQIQDEGKQTFKTNSSLQGVEVVDNGRALDITWTDKVISRFHGSWLRYNCHCGECRHHVSNQRILDVATVSHVTSVTDVTMTDDGDIELTWVEDGHRGVIGQDFLRFYRYDDDSLRHKYESTEPVFLKEKPIPEIEYSEMKNSDYGLYNWLTNIGDYGICLLKGVPTEKNYIKRVVTRIGPVQDTVYGDIFDVKQEENPTNIAYTDKALCFHMDQQPYCSPPGIQFLHCLQFDDTVLGGETLFIDMFHMAEVLREQHPEHFNTFLTIPVLFERIHHERNVHLMCQRKHITLNRENQVTEVHWHPHMEGPLQARHDEVDRYYRAYRTFVQMIEDWPYVKAIRLRPGDMICFNNHRMSHGRRAYDATANGARFLQGCYVNVDEFRSLLQSLTTQFGDGGLARKVGNDSMM